MSSPSKNNIPDYVSNVFGDGGILSEAEAKQIENILTSADQFNYPTSNLDKNWENLKAKVTETKVRSIQKSSVVPFIIRWSIAAVLVLSIALGLWKYNSKSEPTQFVYSTGMEIKKVSLPDGSIVTLNSFSKIITNDLKEDEREVSLTGEAYFEVNHNNTPFVVKTKRGDIRVTGTKFNVRSRVELPFQVALAEGQVIFSSDKGKIVLKPGDVITSKNESTFIKSSINESTLSWIESKLVFNNETLSFIITSLESQYNIKFDYDEKLKNEKLTLTFDHLSASQAAELLSRTLNSKVSIK